MSRIGNLSSRIFVGGLDHAVDEVDLEKAFKLFGEITNVMVMRDRETGRSRGFAFISFKDSQASEEAISRMHGVEIRGRCVSVGHAERERHLDDKSPGGGNFSGVDTRFGATRSLSSHGGGNFRGGGRYRPSDRVFVTDDEERMNKRELVYSGCPRSPLSNRRPREESPPRRVYAASPTEYPPQRQAGLMSDQSSIHGSRRGHFTERSYGQMGVGSEDLSPTRELNAYINSRGRSYSPLLQLSRKVNTEAAWETDEGYRRPSIKSSAAREDYQAYHGRQEINTRKLHPAPARQPQSLTSRYGDVSSDRSKREYRSRSPRPGSAHSARRSPHRPSRSENVRNGNWGKHAMDRIPRKQNSQLDGKSTQMSPLNRETRGNNWGTRGQGLDDSRFERNEWNRRGRQESRSDRSNYDERRGPRDMEKAGWSRDGSSEVGGRRPRENENRGSSRRNTESGLSRDYWAKLDSERNRGGSPVRARERENKFGYRSPSGESHRSQEKPSTFESYRDHFPGPPKGSDYQYHRSPARRGQSSRDGSRGQFRYNSDRRPQATSQRY